MSVETTTLLPAVARGDLVTFEQLYDRYSSTLYALRIRILGNPEDAQEVLQETAIGVARQLPDFIPGCSIWFAGEFRTN